MICDKIIVSSIISLS